MDSSLPEYVEPKVTFKDDFVFKDTFEKFSITRVNRDPFLGTIERPKTLDKGKNVKKKKLTWKPIDYLGMITNNANKDRVFILSINNKQVLLKRGHIHDSVKVIRGDSKKITLKYRGNTKNFKLKS